MLELACGLRVVSALLLRQRSCRVSDGALGNLVETRFLDQLERFDGPSCRVSPIADLCGREGHVAETEEPYVCELWPVVRKSECLTEHVDCFLRSAQENVRRPQGATGAEEPAGALALLRRVDELGVTQHPVDSVGSGRSSDNGECGTKRVAPSADATSSGFRSAAATNRLARTGSPSSTAHPGGRDRQLCVGFDLLVGAAVEPEPEGLDLPATCELVPVPERDPAGLREIAALVRVGERLVRASVHLAPICCPDKVAGSNSGWRRLSSARRKSLNRWW